jgi:hypothetical protein
VKFCRWKAGVNAKEDWFHKVTLRISALKYFDVYGTDLANLNQRRLLERL